MTDVSRIARYTLSSATGLRIQKVQDRRESGIVAAPTIDAAGPSHQTSVVVRGAAETPDRRKFHLIDADGLDVARAASAIATILRGKRDPDRGVGGHVVVINAEKVRLPSAKTNKKPYHKHSGFGCVFKGPGAKPTPRRFPERVLEKAVERMILCGPYGEQQIAKLRILKGAAHDYPAHDLQLVDIAGLRPTSGGGRKYRVARFDPSDQRASSRPRARR